jgi:hypothetical protein
MAVDKVHKYVGAGWTPAQIAKYAGLNHSTVKRIAAGENRRLAAHTIIQLVELPDPSASIIGVRRRLQGLAVLGWSAREISEMVGCSTSTIFALRNGKQTTFRQVDLQAIVDVCEKLCMEPAPDDRFHNRARMDARRRGWLPILAWDDDIDLPDAQPAGATSAANRGGYNRKLPEADTVARLANQHGSRSVSHTYGCSQKQVATFLRRNGYTYQNGRWELP